MTRHRGLALKVAEELWKRFGHRVALVEPYAQELPRALAGASLLDFDSALAACEIVVVLVDHDLFKNVDRQKLAGKTIYDTRGIWPL